MTINEQVLCFSSGENLLFGVLHEPDTALDTAVVVLVGGPQYRAGSHRMFVEIARNLAFQGYPSLRFDFSGMGDSEGEFPGFENLDRDVAAAVDELQRSCPRIQRYVLLGLCDGATAAALFAPTDPRIAGVVMLNPWVHTVRGEAKVFLWRYYPQRVLQADFWRRLLSGKIAYSRSIRDFLRGVGRVLGIGLSAAPQTATMDFVERLRIAMSEFRGRIFVVTSEHDFTAAEFLGLWDGSKEWRRVASLYPLRTLDGADHTLSSKADMDSFCSLVGDWLRNQFDRSSAGQYE